MSARRAGDSKTLRMVRLLYLTKHKYKRPPAEDLLLSR
jgi:hypothetical protein